MENKFTNNEDGIEAIVTPSGKVENPWKVIFRDIDADATISIKFGPSEAWAIGEAEAFVTGRVLFPGSVSVL